MAVAGGRDGYPVRCGRRGFALVETAMAMVLLALIVMGTLCAVLLAHSAGASVTGGWS